MYSEEIGQSLIFQLRNIAYKRFDSPSEYSNIISPFSRIYLITEGEGKLIIGKKKISLEAEYMYIIPAFTSCSYFFNAELCHFYIHMGISLANGINASSLFTLNHKVKSGNLEKLLFERLLEICPNFELPHHDPHVYQTKPWINKKVSYSSAAQHLETLGISEHLFSKFISSEPQIQATSLLKYNLQPILLYIQDNLQNDITIEELACMACFSKDHFTRIFKSIIGMAPYEFIIRKRIEQAQLLLLTTDLTLNEIIEKTNLKSASYFNRIFRKYTSYTPGKYRSQVG